MYLSRYCRRVHCRTYLMGCNQNTVKQWSNMEQQITDLQSRLSFLEDSVDELTRTVVDQQSQLSDLQQLLLQLQQQLRAITPSDIDAEIDVKPPHY